MTMRFPVALLVIVFYHCVEAYDGDETTEQQQRHRPRALRSTPADSSSGVDGAIQRALDFLWRNQVREDITFFDGLWLLPVSDYEGNWPQFFDITDLDFLPQFREVSSFIVSFIHHSLSWIVEENQEVLGLADQEIDRAREMRRRAADNMKRFKTPEDEPGAGSIGFWPEDTTPNLPGPLVSFLVMSLVRGPILLGNRVPLNISPVYPDDIAIEPDADCTACAYSSLLDDAEIDGGPAFDTDDVIKYFTDFRDLGEIPLRDVPDWLPEESGAFLTWLSYENSGTRQYVENDVDLHVNANVLWFMGRVDKLDTPGVAETIDLINDFVSQGLHRDPGQYCLPTVYYPNSLAFQYFVSRAYYEGGVTGLSPSVDTFVDDLVHTVKEHKKDDTAYWDLGEPHLNTAYAVLVLLNAGAEMHLVEKAVNFLVEEQDSQGGFNDDGTFFCAKMDGGQLINWYSESFTTGMVLEALARWKIASQS